MKTEKEKQQQMIKITRQHKSLQIVGTNPFNPAARDRTVKLNENEHNLKAEREKNLACFTFE